CKWMSRYRDVGQPTLRSTCRELAADQKRGVGSWLWLVYVTASRPSQHVEAGLTSDLCFPGRGVCFFGVGLKTRRIDRMTQRPSALQGEVVGYGLALGVVAHDQDRRAPAVQVGVELLFLGFCHAQPFA